MENNRRLIPGDIYRHFKNKLYQIITVATHSETKEAYVVYQALYGDFKTYIRPYDMFMSEVDRNKYPDVKQKYRFEKVDVVAPTEIDGTTVPDKSGKISVAPRPETMSAIRDSVTAEIMPTEMDMDNSGVNPYLMEFFDKNSFADKIEYLNSIKNRMDDRLINDICASLDITVDEGEIDVRYSSLIACLSTMARFECGRLR